MLSPDIIGAIRTLLMRVEIKGAEVPAFNSVMNALQDYENERRIPPPPLTVVGGGSEQ